MMLLLGGGKKVWWGLGIGGCGFGCDEEKGISVDVVVLMGRAR